MSSSLIGPAKVYFCKEVAMVIQCPRCRTQLRFPDDAAGKTTTCLNPACGTRFVIPEATNLPSVRSGGGVVPARRSSSVSSLDPSEITIELAGTRRRPASVTIHTSQPSNSMGIVSLIVGILALLLCWLPMMNRLGYTIGALGVVLGLLGLVVASQQRGVSVGFPIGGLVLSLVGLVLAFQMDQGLQGIKKQVATALKETADDVEAGKRPTGGKRPVKGAQATSNEPKEWADATRIVLTRGTASVKVAGVRIDKATRYGINGRQELGPYLLIELRVTNKSDTKKIDFEGWSSDFDLLGPTCSLVDEHGNKYQQMKVGPGGTWDGLVLNEPIAPRSSLTDLLIFEPPVDPAKELHLEIPGEPLGIDGWFRFKIPQRMWEENRPLGM